MVTQNKKVTKDRNLPEIKLAYTPAKEPLRIKGIIDAYELFTKIWCTETFDFQEKFYCIFTRGQMVIGWKCFGIGGVDQVSYSGNMIDTYGLQVMANGVWVAHNHPSGDVRLSPQDKVIKEFLSKLLNVTGLVMHDFFVITKDGFVSNNNIFLSNERFQELLKS